MPTKRTRTWTEKLSDPKDLPKIVELTEKQNRVFGEGTMFIPSPLLVDSLMRQVTPGKLTTINDIRTFLAGQHGTNTTCPITTGIFSWIAAHASEEQAALGKTDATPYWRTLKLKGEINPKYPGGVQAQINLLEAEGHEVYQKGKKFFVRGYEKDLVKLHD